MTKITDALDKFFVHSQYAFEQLGEEFNMQDFYRKIAIKDPHTYINVLQACYDRENPFRIAHTQIGSGLLKVAEKFGYEKTSEVKVSDIFGNPAQVSAYRRKHR
jgi:hypothetical protein